MKNILLLLLCISFLSLKGQISNIKLTKIKINSKDKYPIKGYLYDIDEEKIVIALEKEMIKGFLLTESCKSCYTVPLTFIRDIKFSQKKAFLPAVSMAAGGLGLLLIATADNTPNPDGINDRQAFQILTLMGLVIGGGIDLLRLIGQNKKKPLDINMGISNVLQSKSALYQFNEQRNQQLDKLTAILQEIEKHNTSYRKQIKVYTKDKELVVGYIKGQQGDMLLIGADKKQIFSHKEDSSKQFDKLSLQDIFYYEFVK